MKSKFKFSKPELNQKFIKILDIMEVQYNIDESGFVVSDKKDEFILDDIQCVIRTSIFDDWHLISDGGNEIPWNQIFRKNIEKYFTEKKIDYIGEICDDEHWYATHTDIEIPEDKVAEALQFHPLGACAAIVRVGVSGAIAARCRGSAQGDPRSPGRTPPPRMRDR